MDAVQKETDAKSVLTNGDTNNLSISKEDTNDNLIDLSKQRSNVINKDTVAKQITSHSSAPTSEIKNTCVEDSLIKDSDLPVDLSDTKNKNIQSTVVKLNVEETKENASKDCEEISQIKQVIYFKVEYI